MSEVQRWAIEPNSESSAESDTGPKPDSEQDTNSIYRVVSTERDRPVGYSLDLIANL